MDGYISIVIKVKYGDVLRRLKVHIVDKKLDLNLDGLRKKIVSLFNFASDAKLTLTYIDEDGDVVTLVDDDDLNDVVHQALNPLRITVKLNSEDIGKKFEESNDLSARDLNSVVSEILNYVPEPFQGTISPIVSDLVAKAASVAPGSISELIDYSNLALSNLSEQSGNLSRDARDSHSPLSNVSPGGALKVILEVISQLASNNKVKSQDVTAGSMVTPSGTVTANSAVQPVTGSLGQTKSDDFGKFGETFKSCNVSSTDMNMGKGVNEFSDTKVGPSTPNDSASAHINGENADQGKLLSDGSSAYPGLVAGILTGPVPPFECPFSGISQINMPPAPLNSAYNDFPFWRSGSPNDNTGAVFHRGIRCDGCGVHPIAGTRYKSLVKYDYDLCSSCFEKEGNSTGYIRMDHPAVHRDMPFRVPLDGQARYRAVKSHPHRVCKAKQSSAARLDSRFIQDVNLVDGTVVSPLTPFTKIWRMRNNGSLAWPPKTQLVWIGGDKLSSEDSAEVEIPLTGLPVDQLLDVAVDFISPELPGRYVSYWRLASPSGLKFGQRVWVLIQVDASVDEMPYGNIPNLNLNLPPPTKTLESMAVDTNLEAGGNNPEKMVELEEAGAAVGVHVPNIDHEMKFPINDNLIVGQSAPPPTTYIESAPAGTLSLPVEKNKEVLEEDTDEMGFEHIDLRKEMLRMEEYDLDWNHLLEELQEMGFHDKELNMKLLEKNNGSIHRVVLSLVAGEKAAP